MRFTQSLKRAHNAKYSKNMCCYYMKNKDLIIYQICTCHDSWAVMTCANSDWMIILKIRAKRNIFARLQFNLIKSWWDGCQSQGVVWWCLASTDAGSATSNASQSGGLFCTVAWYRCTTPVLFCGHRRSPLLLESMGRERRWPRWIKKGVAYRYQATVLFC